MTEELFEEGIVVKSVGGIAEIKLKDNGNCEECTAKIFCSPQNNNSRTLKVLDSFESQPGDEVKISINGSEVLKISILLYGVPLVLLLAGIAIGMSLFENTNSPEFYGFLTGLVVVSLYFGIFYVSASKRKEKNLMPIIVTRNRPN